MTYERVGLRRAWGAAAGALLVTGALVSDVCAQKENNPLTPEELIERIEQQDQILAEQKRQIEEQERKLGEYRAALERILAKEKLQSKALDARRGTGASPTSGASPTTEPVSSEGSAREQARREQAREDTSGGAVVAQSEGENAQQPPATPAGQPPESATRPPEVAPLGELQSVLTPRGKFVFEPSLEYSTNSNGRVALVGFTIIPGITIGLIDIRNVSGNFVAPVLTARYGVTSRSEVELRVPYVFRWESTTARPLATPSFTDQVFDVNGNGLGDIEINGRYQFNVGSSSMPFFIGSLRFKTTTGKGPFDVSTIEPIAGLIVPTQLPTGTGFYALQPGLTALYPTDPAVFFGTLTYTWNIADDINNVGRYDPGDAVGFTFGMGLGINERASFSLGYEQNFWAGDKVNGQSVPGAPQSYSTGRLLFGLSYQFTKSTNFNMTLGVGVTQYSPDVTLTFRLPMTF